ncbi:acyltransferase family protein [Vibrio cholerae]|uniref:acyltransferase family protein n=1 Tax=Vibrio cholerae TaxID=666 RepID=UPI00226D59D4|nr:acyltransferase [Vibrio cholerae]MCX9536051.1 acyltransferase [Vibrio cholerae]
MSSVPHRKDIQGLRAIAVLAVMVFHLNPTWLPGGFVGVDVFLVISGFLITSILLHKKSSAGYSLTETLKYFYVSRFKRIVPAYFLMLIIVALVAAVLFLPSDFNTFRKGLEKATWFSSNRYFADFGDYFAPASNEQPLLHTWSLAVEIQFYLLAPFIVLLLPIRLLKWFFVVLLIGLTALAEYHLRFLGMEQATYYSLYARLPEFFVGGLAALYVTTVSRVEGSTAWLGILGMLLIVNFCNYPTTARVISWHSSSVTCRWKRASTQSANTRMGRRIVELQNSGVAWWAVLFTLPLALASIGLFALLHKCRGTRYRIQHPVCSADIHTIYCFLLWG